MTAALIPHSRIRGAIRRLWLFSPQRRECLKRSKVIGVAKGHLCDGCGKVTTAPQVDHVESVGATPGSRGSNGATWDEFMRRMFVAADGLQTLCEACHDLKTKLQRRHREIVGGTSA